MDEKRRRENALAARCEDNVNRVVHAAGHHRLDAAAVRAAAEDVRRLGDEGRLARPLVALLGKRSLGPVNPTVWPEIWPLQIVRTSRRRLALEPLAALVRHAVPLRIDALPI